MLQIIEQAKKHGGKQAIISNHQTYLFSDYYNFKG